MTTSTFDEVKAEVAEKVRKLLAQAEDRAATPEEANSFTMKAQELMSKYSIEQAMLADAGRSDEMVERGWTLFAPYASHKVSLVNAVARSNDCRAIYAEIDGGRRRISVVGHAADVEWVETLSLSLEVQMASALGAAMRTRPRHVHGRTYAVGFIQGFVGEVARRLERARAGAVASAEATQASTGDVGAASSVALVLVAKAQRVEEEFRVRHPRTRTVYAQTRLQSWAGYAPGRAAGERASIAKGAVGGNGRSLAAG